MLIMPEITSSWASIMSSFVESRPFCNICTVIENFTLLMLRKSGTFCPYRNVQYMAGGHLYTSRNILYSTVLNGYRKKAL
jgi:hypothetical protein